jgi:signal transduction histidine kinase
MTAEPILAFFLLRYLRKTLRTTSLFARWDKLLNYAVIGVVVLFVIQVVFSAGAAIEWIWHVIILLIIGLCFKENELYPARNTMLAILPVALVFFVSDLIKLLPDSLYQPIKDYPDFALPFAIIWMVAMLIIYRKQRKAIEAERMKTHEEEEQNRIMAARKAELEILVAERTSEIMQQKNELEHALLDLRTTQAQLIQAEKMASLGELTAGIAHEIQNPLNFVNNFSEVNAELIEELKRELNTGNKEEAVIIADNIRENEEKIIHHGKRADGIVKSMLQHSRSNSGEKELTDINALADEYLRLSYHGLRAKDKTFNATFKTDFDTSIDKISIVPQDIGRVILNLVNNAFHAVMEKRDSRSLNGSEKYEPTVLISTRSINSSSENGGVEIRIKDNGNGIPQKVADKIFQPFFTTKPTGQGTGLGLSLSYDIIKAHNGTINVETKEGEGAEFIIQLPLGKEL